jgi:hypothetical protein
MTTHRPTNHTLLWKSPRAPDTNPLMGWRRYEWWEKELRFKRTGHEAPLAGLAISAVEGAIAANRNVTITKIDCDPNSTPSSDLLTKFALIRPVTLICPERLAFGGADVRWTMAWLTSDVRKAQPQTLPEVAIQAAITTLVKEDYPVYNQAPSMYSVPSLILRHDTTAEDLGIVEARKITPDDICGSVADDPEVAAATAQWDRATPETYRELVRARLAAQERRGIPEAQRAPLYSGDVEGLLTPLLMRMGRDDEAAVIAHLRRDLRVKYGEYAQTVLLFMLRSYRKAARKSCWRLRLRKPRRNAP